MNAADVLAEGHESWWNADTPGDTYPADYIAALMAVLLAHGNGQGVAILPDGTLWALEPDGYQGDYDDDVLWGEAQYILVPISAEAGDTDA